jgi:hypothetical protein
LLGEVIDRRSGAEVRTLSAQLLQIATTLNASPYIRDWLTASELIVAAGILLEQLEAPAHRHA